MKRILIGALSLAIAAGGLFAQEEKKEGFKFSGNVVTGFRFDAKQYLDDNTSPWLNTGDAKNRDPGITVWHDDAGVVRLEINASYTRETYGFVTRVKFLPYELYNKNGFNGGVVFDLLQQAYIWADFWDKKIRLTSGKIDDGTWGTAGAEGFNYSTGLGARLEIKPIDSLNFGVFFNPGEDAHSNLTFLGSSTPDLDKNDQVSRQVDSFFKETAFGVKFIHNIIDVAAGLRLDGQWDGLPTKEWYGYTTWDNKSVDSDEGLRFYFGVDVKAVPNLKAAAEVQFYNMGKFNDYGWVWLNEKFAYKLDPLPLTVGINMHQWFFAEDHHFVPYFEDQSGDDPNHSVLPNLEFVPNAAYKVSEKVDLELEIPFKIWPEVTWNIGFKPKVIYNLGTHAKISGYYELGFTQYHLRTGKGGMNNNGDWRTPDGLLSHAIQINLECSF